MKNPSGATSVPPLEQSARHPTNHPTTNHPTNSSQDQPTHRPKDPFTHSQKTTRISLRTRQPSSPTSVFFQRILAENAGHSHVDAITALYAAHQKGETAAGIDVDAGPARGHRSTEARNVTPRGRMDVWHSLGQSLYIYKYMLPTQRSTILPSARMSGHYYG